MLSGSFCHERIALAVKAAMAFVPFNLACSCVAADYEIQVYGSETVAPKRTMVELHSNYTISGDRELINGVYPSYHALHETIEITHGFTPWFETGFYIFSSLQPGRRLGMGGRQHPSPGARAGGMALAGGG